MTPERLQSLLTLYREDLLQNVVPFWEQNAPDREKGGFLFNLDRDGSVYGTDKPVWIQGRYTWLCSRLYNTVEKRPEWLELAQHGARFLKSHCFDTDGRMFFSVTRDGRPLRKRRYVFSETFAIIAFAELARATGDEKLAREALDLFKLTHRYLTTPGLLEPKTIPTTRQTKGLAIPMILLGTIQVLRLAVDDPLLTEVADQALQEIEHHFLNHDLQVVMETVGPQGEFIDTPEGRSVNPGHAIEAGWFILEESRHRKDPRLQELGLRIIDWSLAIGWDETFGGIYYFRDVKGLPCPQYEHDMKLWWPHNEAIYGTLLAYHLTGDPKYSRWHRKIHDWAYGRFPDPDHGEWYGYLHRDGTVANRLKGNMWKGPFHLPRMLLYSWKLLEEMVQTPPAARSR
jgi:N-acylglucosamine 2-epimerase